MSLKDKITVLKNEDLREYASSGEDFPFINPKDYFMAVFSYQDAIKNYKKYLDLLSSFAILLSKKSHCNWSVDDVLSYLDADEVTYMNLEWRDFCFKHFIGDEE